MTTICTLRVKTDNYFWLTNATGMNVNGYGMINDDNISLFWDNEGRSGFRRGQNEELGFCKTLSFWS